MVAQRSTRLVAGRDGHMQQWTVHSQYEVGPNWMISSYAGGGVVGC
jgi:hypothetical protein